MEDDSLAIPDFFFKGRGPHATCACRFDEDENLLSTCGAHRSYYEQLQSTITELEGKLEKANKFISRVEHGEGGLRFLSAVAYLTLKQLKE